MGAHARARAFARPCATDCVCVRVRLHVFVRARLLGCVGVRLCVHARGSVCAFCVRSCLCVCAFEGVQRRTHASFKRSSRGSHKLTGSTLGYSGGTPRKRLRACVAVHLLGCIPRAVHGTARELLANWLHSRGTRRVLTPAFCRAVHRCACVCAVTPAPTLTPARSPTLAPTTAVPAVAPSGMSFLEYPRAP